MFPVLSLDSFAMCFLTVFLLKEPTLARRRVFNGPLLSSGLEERSYLSLSSILLGSLCSSPCWREYYRSWRMGEFEITHVCTGLWNVLWIERVCTGSCVEIADEMRYCGSAWTPLLVHPSWISCEWRAGGAKILTSAWLLTNSCTAVINQKLCHRIFGLAWLGLALVCLFLRFKNHPGCLLHWVHLELFYCQRKICFWGRWHSLTWIQGKEVFCVSTSSYDKTSAPFSGAVVVFPVTVIG